MPLKHPSRHKGSRFAAGLLSFLLPAFAVASAGEYFVKPEAFLEQAFEGETPDASLVWLTGERGDMAERILGHKAQSLRVRYWRRGERTAWILDEIGREKFITAGFVIDGRELANVRVLAFRESRGWEIKHDFFTDQFRGARLAEDSALNKPIDNITGATLSVNAMKRMARLALYLDGVVRDDTP